MNLEQDFDTYRANVALFPGIADKLADDLGVSIKAVETLGVGYLPAPDRAWVFAERDEVGDIIGLCRRYADGKKFTVTGSKRGLYYVVNPKYGSSTTHYRHGKHNWTAATKAYRCPVCNRDHYCLLSKTDVTNPPAVICTKVSEGGRDLGDSGWLHILRPDLTSTTAGVMVSSDLPVLIVEGASDVLAALTLGFQAIGRPSDQGGTNFLVKMPLSNRDVVVIGENDAGAGVKGMELCFSILQGKAKSVTKVMPPDGIKDLRGWVAAGVTQKELLAAFAADGDSTGNPNTFPNEYPTTIAKIFLEQVYGSSVNVTLHKYRKQWYQFVKEENVYEVIEEDSLKAKLYTFLDGKLVSKASPKGSVIAEYSASEHKVRDVIGALMQWCQRSSTIETPCWIGEQSDINLDDCIPFKNGWLDFKELTKGKLVLHPPTPNLFNFIVVPYEYDPEAASPAWDKFLNQIFEGDAERIRLLQQWFGYVLTPDTSYEKMMLLTGLPRSGKSTVVEVMTHVCGTTMCGASDFAGLSDKFGLQSLMHKHNIIISDSRTAKTKEARSAMEKILQITGCDSVGVNVKFGTPLASVTLPGRFTLVMNELPSLEDNTQALQSRMNLIKFNRSYLGKEDRSLKRRLTKEADAGKIINFALQGLIDLRKSNNFCEPESCKAAVHEYIMTASPVLDFLSACCTQSVRDRVSKPDLYTMWKLWCSENGRRPGSAVQFRQGLNGALPFLVETRPKTSGTRIRWYVGLGLTEEAKVAISMG